MKNLIKSVIKRLYALCLRVIEACFGIQRAKVFDARLRFRRRIDLKRPTTLADKVCWLSLMGDTELMARCTDKWEARSYVREKGLEDILIPVYGEPVTDAAKIPYDCYPDQFALKATHGCKMNYVCADHTKLDQEDCRRHVARWLNTTYGTYSVEPHYRHIPHRAYCEAYLGASEELIDYKVFCYNGVPQFIMVCCGRKTCVDDERSNTGLMLYDTQWRRIHAIQRFMDHYPAEGEVERPEHLERLLEVAGILSADFPFVRVDLYDVHGQVYFGELTFTPANGVFPSLQESFLRTEGAKLKLPQNR